MFYLKSPPNKDGSCLIYLQFNFRNNRLRLSAELTINPSQWDAEKERPKRSFKHFAQYKARLDKYENTIQETYLNAKLTHVPTVNELKEAVRNAFNPHTVTVHSFAYQIAQTKKKLTRYAYINVGRVIEGFNPGLTFDVIDSDVLYEFKDYLYKQGYSQNTVAKMFQRFKSIINDAIDAGITNNVRHKTKRVQVNYQDTTHIFLDEAELLAMYQFDLPTRLSNARDVFLVAAFTGVRYSDIWKIGKDSFRGRHFRIMAQKESQTIDIPAHPIVMAIMEKHKWLLPKISNVKLNLYIKDVGKLAKIDRQVIVTSFPGGERHDVLTPKYEMITVHTARRSLICNMIIAGVAQEVIMAISGHKTYSAYKRYVKLTPQNFLELAYKSTFFKEVVKAV